MVQVVHPSRLWNGIKYVFLNQYRSITLIIFLCFCWLSSRLWDCLDDRRRSFPHRPHFRPLARQLAVQRPAILGRTCLPASQPEAPILLAIHSFYYLGLLLNNLVFTIDFLHLLFFFRLGNVLNERRESSSQTCQNRSLFIQDLILSSLVSGFNLDEVDDPPIVQASSDGTQTSVASKNCSKPAAGEFSYQSITSTYY